MKINNIQLHNFSSFAGICNFDLSVSNGKNIIIIGGQNGTGKTSLFTAIKLALYGPLCFGYQSNNNQYIAKVKELLNHDAFTENVVKAFVELQIEISYINEKKQYTLKRVWEYNNRKLNEVLYVYENDIALDSGKLQFFLNYLYTIIPPNLFDFFFFDGEQIADFFATANYKSFVRSAVLTLCSIDTLELIKKFSDNFVNNNENSVEHKKLSDEYERLIGEISDCKREKTLTELAISHLLEQQEENEKERTELEYKFRNSGGLTQTEKDEFDKALNIQEKKKEEANNKIKAFVENDMPFIIGLNISTAIREQIEKENEVQEFISITNKVNQALISKSINKIGFDDSNDLSVKLYKELYKQLNPNVKIENFSFIHDLSKEQLRKVYAVLDSITGFKKNIIVSEIKKKQTASKITSDINKKLRAALPEFDANHYLERLAKQVESEYDIKYRLINENELLEKLYATLEKLESRKKMMLAQLKSVAKDQSAYELTQKLSEMFDLLIMNLVADKFKEIEVNIQDILNQILRKDNFIDLVEFDETFDFNIYKKQRYSFVELLNLVENLGNEELTKRLGKQGIRSLLNNLELESVQQVKRKLIFLIDNGINNDIELYSKIEFNRLSKGEKQVFVLSLYWSIIKASNINIPFIIDTPYARIDTNHREYISQKYFPTISEQVIIFSTDEEITENYYKILKPYISKEYLLKFDEENSQTVVKDGYFF